MEKRRRCHPKGKYKEQPGREERRSSQEGRATSDHLASRRNHHANFSSWYKAVSKRKKNQKRRAGASHDIDDDARFKNYTVHGNRQVHFARLSKHEMQVEGGELYSSLSD